MSKKVLNAATLEDAGRTGTLTPAFMELDCADLEDAAHALAELHNAGSIDWPSILLALDRDSLSTRESMRWTQVFVSSLPTLSCDCGTIVGLCCRFSGSSNSRNWHQVIDAFEKWLENNPDQVPNMVIWLCNQDRDSELGFSALEAWRNIDARKALAVALDITADQRPHMRSQAIRALGNFDLDAFESDEHAKARLIDLSNSESKSDRADAIGAIIRLLNNGSSWSENLGRTLEVACIDPSTEV